MSEPYRAMLRGSTVGAALAGASLVVLGALLGGAPAALGAFGGAAVVVLLSGSTLVVMAAARRVEPAMTLGIAMALYTTKVSLLFLLVPAMSAAPAPVRSWAGAAAAAAVVAGSVGLLIAFVRARMPVFAADHDYQGLVKSRPR